MIGPVKSQSNCPASLKNVGGLYSCISGCSGPGRRKLQVWTPWQEKNILYREKVMRRNDDGGTRGMPAPSSVSQVLARLGPAG